MNNIGKIDIDIRGNNAMKLLIAGSRSITDFDLAKYIDEDVDVILSGGAKGDRYFSRRIC